MRSLAGSIRGPDLERFRVIYLTDGKLHPQNVKRMDVTAELLESYVGEIRRYASSGECRLARLLSSMNLGDYLSLSGGAQRHRPVTGRAHRKSEKAAGLSGWAWLWRRSAKGWRRRHVYTATLAFSILTEPQ